MAMGFQATQAQFAAYLRNPSIHPAPADADPRRMAMYRELFFNNINSFLSSNFPVLRTLLDDAQWQALAQDFFASHQCQTPHFSQIAEEFLAYLQNERPQQSGDLPFLLELAHYEWVEMALSIAQDEPLRGDDDFVAQVLDRLLALSPVAWPLAYRYPVERISPEFMPDAVPEQPTYLIVYRDASDEVHFMRTTPLTFRLLQLIDESGEIAGHQALQHLADEFQQFNSQELSAFGAQTLRELAEKGIVIPAVNV